MCQKNKNGSNKKLPWLKVLGISTLLLVVVAISSIWFLKSDAFQTQFVSIFDKNGGVIDKFNFAGNEVLVSNGKIRSNLVSIRKVGFPFSPGILMDIDLIIDPSNSDQGNQSTVHIPLNGIRIDSDLFSVSSISFWIPKYINLSFKDRLGIETLVSLKNKRMVFKLIGKDDGQEFQVQALNMDVKIGPTDNSDYVHFTTLSAVLKESVKKQHVVFDTHGVKLLLSSGKSLDFSRIAYAGNLADKPNFTDPESQKLMSFFQAQGGNNLLAWRKMLRKIAESSTTGDADFNLIVSPQTYVTSQLYFSPNQKKSDMKINGNIRMSDVGSIMNRLSDFGIPVANIAPLISALELIGNRSTVEGIEHLEIGAKYEDGVFSINKKPVIILPKV